MAYSIETTETVDSETLKGVKIILRKMTEGRRLELRGKISKATLKARELLKEQDELLKVPEASRDTYKLWEIQEKLDDVYMVEVNPLWIDWGVAKIEGLELGNDTLGVDRWRDWPSVFFNEVLELVKDESSLNGAERKNSLSSSISGELEDLSPRSSTAESVEKRDIGREEIADSTMKVN